jgi:hypothetical protein
MKNLKPKCDKKKEKELLNSQTSKKKRQKKKIFPCKLYPFNIDVCFEHQNTSCTLLKIVYIFKLGISLNNKIIYKFIFICMVKEKTNGNYDFNF